MRVLLILCYRIWTCNCNSSLSDSWSVWVLTFDREKIRAAGYSDTVAVMVVNMDDYATIHVNPRSCSTGDVLFTLEK